MADVARSNDPPSLVALATIALLAASPDDEAGANACAHLAIGRALTGDPGGAVDLARQARELDPSQVPTWLGLLVELAPSHPEVAVVSKALTEALAPTEPDPRGAT